METVDEQPGVQRVALAREGVPTSGSQRDDVFLQWKRSIDRSEPSLGVSIVDESDPDSPSVSLGSDEISSGDVMELSDDKTFQVDATWNRPVSVVRQSLVAQIVTQGEYDSARTIADGNDRIATYELTGSTLRLPSDTRGRSALLLLSFDAELADGTHVAAAPLRVRFHRESGSWLLYSDETMNKRFNGGVLSTELRARRDELLAHVQRISERTGLRIRMETALTNGASNLPVVAEGEPGHDGE